MLIFKLAKIYVVIKKSRPISRVLYPLIKKDPYHLSRRSVTETLNLSTLLHRAGTLSPIKIGTQVYMTFHRIEFT